MAVSHIKVDTIADFTGTVTVFNSVGSTQTANATDLVRPSDWNSAHNQYMTIAGNTAGASTLSGTNIVLQGGNNVTLSANGQTLVFSGPATAAQTVQTQNMVSVQGSTGAIVFNNSNGITFGGNASTVTASVETAYAASTHSHGNPTLFLTNISGTTASASNGLTLSLSAGAGGGGAFTAGLSGGNTSGDTGTVSNRIVFAGGNNITVSGSTNAGGMSVTISGANAGGAQTGISGIVVSDTTYSSGTVSFSNANGITFGSSAGQAITINHALQFTSNTSAITSNALNTSASRVINVIAATNSTGGGTASLSSNVSFSAANGVTFYTSAGNAIVGSVVTSYRASNDAIGLNTAQTNVTWTVNSSGLSINAAGYAGTGTTFNGTNASASMTLNSNGLRLDLSAANGGGGVNSGTFYATGNTTQSSSGTIALSSIIVQGTGGVSAGISNGSIIVSGPSLSSLSATGALSASSNGSTISLGVGTVTVTAASNTTQASSGTINLNGLIFAGAGGVSVGVSNGSMVISGGAGGGGGVALSAGTQSVSTGTVAFANSNGITFGMSGSSQVTASYNSTQFAGTGTTFAGANVSASMTMNSAGLNLSVSVAPPGAAAENNAHALLGANTAGNTTATGSTIGLSGLNLTLSGTNASQIVISAPATSLMVGAGGVSLSTNGSTISVSYPQMGIYEPNQPSGTGYSSFGQNTLYFLPFNPPVQVTASVINMVVSLSHASSSVSHSVGHTLSYGLYSELTGASTSQISLISSSSIAFQVSASSNLSMGYTIAQGANSTTYSSAGTGSTSAWTGQRRLELPFAISMAPGAEYYFGIAQSTTSTGNTGAFRMSVMVNSAMSNASLGVLAPTGITASNASLTLRNAGFLFSSTSGAWPSTIGNNSRSVASNIRPYIVFVN